MIEQQQQQQDLNRADSNVTIPIPMGEGPRFRQMMEKIRVAIQEYVSGIMVDLKDLNPGSCKMPLSDYGVGSWEVDPVWTSEVHKVRRAQLVATGSYVRVGLVTPDGWWAYRLCGVTPGHCHLVGSGRETGEAAEELVDIALRKAGVMA